MSEDPNDWTSDDWVPEDWEFDHVGHGLTRRKLTHRKVLIEHIFPACFRAVTGVGILAVASIAVSPPIETLPRLVLAMFSIALAAWMVVTALERATTAYAMTAIRRPKRETGE